MNRIKACREAKGMSQKYVAVSLGVKAPSVSDWEKGKTNPTIENLTALADLLGVTCDELLGRTDPVSESQQNADSAANNAALSSDELRLLTEYRSLTPQGREYIRQQMFMATSIYKNADLPGLETVNQ